MLWFQFYRVEYRMLCLAYALINFVPPVKHADVKIFIFASHSQTKTFISSIIYYKQKFGWILKQEVRDLEQEVKDFEQEVRNFEQEVRNI